MPYNPKIDEVIIVALYNHRELGFNEIRKIIEDSHPQITDRVLNRHLDVLENQGIIERDKRDDWKIGTKRHCRLPKNTRLALVLKLPVKVKARKKEFFLLLPKKQGEINQKIYLLLMSLVTTGFSVPVSVNDISTVEAGDFNIGNKPHRMLDTLPGVSIGDLFHKYRDFANGSRFRYIKFNSVSEVKWYFDKLMDFNPPIIMPINNIGWVKIERLQRNLQWPVEGKDNDTRYGIADKLLYNFLLDCIDLLGKTEILMRLIWKCRRQARREEVTWFEFIYGKRYTSNFFTKIDKRRSQIKKIIGTTTKQRKKAETDANATYKAVVEDGNIESSDYKTPCEILLYIRDYETIDRIKAIPREVHVGLDQKYDHIHEKYKVIIDPLMNELAYPGFMNRLLLDKL